MSQPASANTKRQFLVVEHNAHVAATFQALFELLGHELHIALSPDEAFDIVQVVKPEVIYTALVFNDVHGFEICKRMKRMPMLANARVVALTGLQYPGVEVACKDAGFDSYLLKPCTFEQLADTIDSVEGSRVRSMLNRAG